MDSEPEHPTPARRGPQGGKKSSRPGPSKKKPARPSTQKPSVEVLDVPEDALDDADVVAETDEVAETVETPDDVAEVDEAEIDEVEVDDDEIEAIESMRTTPGSGPSFRLSFSPISKPSLGRFSESIGRRTVTEVATDDEALEPATPE
ncbi:MAG: hypothetical protein ACTHKX_01465, partial [Pseudolysinimonas sp.]